MDMDDLMPPPRKDGALAQLLAEDLDRLSLTELDARIAALEGEVARTRAKRAGATAFRSAADSLFKR
ncbi:DUF1192 domain-containing protein [Glacieibacterium frigidum]|uniref:DUF1192 domain-containing protein n=1 Tax=Glacieibacterium frigidum TaxID=2593303 RepID=A0A552UHT5_9SPHN|nr:DUF1192 domain-containing protein [Glacieibacterium frigidum]TRW17786.1 DUF1192 domain-containing protein [Glacieibacterium frigidum]